MLHLPLVSGQRWGPPSSALFRRALAHRQLPLLRTSLGVRFRGAGILHREHSSRCHIIASAATGRTGNELPRDWTQVVSWSASEFRRCVSPDLPDCSLHLAKACLLVALEEEAARSGEAPHPELQELMAAAAASIRPRSAASASTWSGERLEALAAEVAALLDQQLEESAQYRAATAATAAVTEAGPGGEETPSAAAPDAVAAAAEGQGAAVAAASAGAAAPCSDSDASTASSSFDFAAEQEQLLDRIHTSRPGAVGSSRRGASGSSSSRGHSSGGGVGRSGGLDDDGGGGGGISSGEDDDGGERYYGSAWPSGRRVYGRRQALYRRYPVQTLAAVNTVLFDRHGYQPCNRYGVPSDHQLAAVMERGVGASAALSILYLEVCERLGFPLAARPLEDGRYFVLWPADAPLTADGQRFLVDPYGRGGLLLLDEVCEIFGVEEASLRPASRRELLAALLGELRDAHWAAAAGCSPQPGTMTPLSVETALENKVVVPASGVRAASLRRALAAAEKRLWLLPDDSEAQLQYGLLLYFSRRYDDAWIELALYMERFAGRGGAAGGGAGGGETQRPPAEGPAAPGSHPAASPPPPSAAPTPAAAEANSNPDFGVRGLNLGPNAADSGSHGPLPGSSAGSVQGALQVGLGAAEQPASPAGAGGGEAVADNGEARAEASGLRPQPAEATVAAAAAAAAAAATSACPGVTVPGGGVEMAARQGDADLGPSPSCSSSQAAGAPSAAAPAAPSSSLSAQVAVLVERIRLVLDFAPA